MRDMELNEHLRDTMKGKPLVGTMKNKKGISQPVGILRPFLLYLLKRSWQFPNARQLIEIPSLMWKNAAYGLWKLAG